MSPGRLAQTARQHPVQLSKAWTEPKLALRLSAEHTTSEGMALNLQKAKIKTLSSETEKPTHTKTPSYRKTKPDTPTTQGRKNEVEKRNTTFPK